MLTNTSRWSHARGNEMVPSCWQATATALPGQAAEISFDRRVRPSHTPHDSGRTYEPAPRFCWAPSPHHPRGRLCRAPRFGD